MSHFFKNRRKYATLLILILLVSCKTKETQEEITQLDLSSQAAKPIMVKYATAKQQTFPLVLETTGILAAAQKMALRLPKSGIVQQLPIKTGETIKKGDIILKLDDTELQYQLRQRQLALELAIVDKKDRLVSQGGDENNDNSVSPQKLKNILLLSGYNQAALALEQTQFDIQKTTTYAPFDGIIADVQLQQHQQVTEGEIICTLINPNSFEAEFTLLEQEALGLKVGEIIKTIPIALPKTTLKATISSINPIVSNEGLVTVRAVIKSPRNQHLFEGMNLKIIIQKNISNQIVVPKKALILRSGKSVIFTYDTTSQLAKWNYVTIAYENDEQIAIAEGIKPNDLVIVEGNLNLGHDAAVIAHPSITTQ